MQILGIDIGGSAIKGAPVNIRKADLAVPRLRIETPTPVSPIRTTNIIGQIVEHFEYQGPIGVTFPGVVKEGVTLTAANVHRGFVHFDAAKLFSDRLGMPVVVLNDADAAGIAESEHGAGKSIKGVVAVFTFGTGIGSAFFIDGKLFPHTEFGHMKIREKDAEDRCSARIKEKKNLTWKQWAKRVNEFFVEIDRLFTPDLIIIGGGVSKDFDSYKKFLKSGAKIVPAHFFNESGIIGAAIAAGHLSH